MALTRTILAAALVAAVAFHAPAAECPPEDAFLLLHECNGPFTTAAALLPEDAALMTEARGPRLVVTGVYTSTERREEGVPLPVGLFIRAGEIVNRQFGRMDGILLVTPEGRLSLHHRARVTIGRTRYNLTAPARRNAFLAAASEAGLSVLQSHLLIVDGRVDVAQSDDAPRFRRRLLFVDRDGRAGLWQSAGAVTLHDAAMELSQTLGPAMALNLDMGSYDLCLRQEVGDGPREGADCGRISWFDAGKLSNLLIFDLSGR